MTGNRWLALAAVLAVAGFGAFGLSNRGDQVLTERPAAQRPTLALLTSLPLVFGEEFGLDRGGSPALSRLEQRYQVLPIGVADAASLTGKTLLLMAHPRAQPAAALVDLDQWVRDGGHLLLLADPKLDWPSQRPLGDVLRPPPMFADTGLLNHWGVSLSQSGLASTGGCKITQEGLVARCRIGRGRATIIADADFLDVDSTDAPALDPMMVELDRLESR